MLFSTTAAMGQATIQKAAESETAATKTASANLASYFDDSANKGICCDDVCDAQPGCCQAGGCDSGCCGNSCCGQGGCCAAGGNGCCCCPRGGAVFGVEATFLKHGQEGGTNDVFGLPVNFSYEFAPRIWLGWENASGLGIRTRYWESKSNDAVSATGDVINVDAYMVDLEAYQGYDLSRHSDLELAIGIRYLDYRQFLTANVATATVETDSQGFGLTAGLEWKRQMRRGSLYARARGTVGQGDTSLTINTGGGPTVLDGSNNSVAQTEFGLGYEICRQLKRGTLLLRFGVEAQQWSNVAPASTNFGGGLTTFGDVVEDANFSGFVLGGEFRR